MYCRLKLLELLDNTQHQAKAQVVTRAQAEAEAQEAQVEADAQAKAQEKAQAKAQAKVHSQAQTVMQVGPPGSEAEPEARLAALQLPSAPCATLTATPSSASVETSSAAAIDVGDSCNAAVIRALPSGPSPRSLPVGGSAPSPSRSLLQAITIQPWGVLGEAAGQSAARSTTRAAPAPDASTLICDPANVAWLKDPNFYPPDAGGASGAVYKYLNIQRFPSAVAAAMKHVTDAVYHRYEGKREVHVIHVASPRLPTNISAHGSDFLSCS